MASGPYQAGGVGMARGSGTRKKHDIFDAMNEYLLYIIYQHIISILYE